MATKNCAYVNLSKVLKFVQHCIFQIYHTIINLFFSEYLISYILMQSNMELLLYSCVSLLNEDNEFVFCIY